LRCTGGSQKHCIFFSDGLCF